MKSNSNEVEHSRLTSRDELKEKEKTTKTNTKIIFKKSSKQTQSTKRFSSWFISVYILFMWSFFIYKNENLKFIQFDFVFTI